MKKLMIAAAVAALSTGAFASGNAAQVYDVKITVKTTVCKDGKVSNGYLTTVAEKEKGELFAYRTQASRTILGLLWGCGCDQAFSGEWGLANEDKGYWYGNVFWDKKTGDLIGDDYDDTILDFAIINRIGKKANEVEMVWYLLVTPAEGETGNDGLLTLAGFGTIADQIAWIEDDDDFNTCNSVIKSAKGNVAGYLPAPTGEYSGCEYCVESGDCEVFDFCYCSEADFKQEDNTAASGTWTLKYNSSASKKLSKSGYITASYTKFPAALKALLVLAGE